MKQMGMLEKKNYKNNLNGNSRNEKENIWNKSNLRNRKQKIMGAPGYLSWFSVWLLILAQVMIPGSWDRDPHRAHALLRILSLPLPLSPAHTLSLNKKIKKERKKLYFKKMNRALVTFEII